MKQEIAKIQKETQRILTNHHALLQIIPDIVMIVDDQCQIESLNNSGLIALGRSYDSKDNKRRIPELLDILESFKNSISHDERPVIANAKRSEIELQGQRYSVHVSSFVGYKQDNLFMVLLKPSSSEQPVQDKLLPSECLGLIGSSTVFRETLNKASAIAKSEALVLITGESGSGKEVIADFIQSESQRPHKQYNKINCGAISDSLLESELFGYEKGAFTGAHEKKIGLLEQCSGGTLLLDEVGNISPKMQLSLLRTLETGDIRRIGGTKTIHCDIRFLATTNIDLEKAVKDKLFREDLYYRLNVMRIKVPPLRERKSDCIDLTYHFCRKFQMAAGKTIDRIPPETLDIIANYQWPGNVRELENVISRAMVTSLNSELLPEDISLLQDDHNEKNAPLIYKMKDGDYSLPEWLATIEKDIISYNLQANSNILSRTARALKIPKQTLHSKMVKYGLRLK